MPTGELAALSSSLTHAFSSLIDKALTRRLEPLKQAALAALGGTIMTFILLLAFGKVSDLPNAPVESWILSIIGGVLSFGIGFTLFLVFLRSVDVNKAVPLASGTTAILSVVSGIFILGEDLSGLTLGGISAILIGVYMLSFSQRKETDIKQAVWLGFKGMIFLVFVTSFWVGGFSLQAVALRDLDPLTANTFRLPAIFVFLSLLSIAGVGKYLRPQRGQDVITDGSRSPTMPRRDEVSGSTSGGQDWLWKRRKVELRIRGSADAKQIDDLKTELAGINGVAYDTISQGRNNSLSLYMYLPRTVSAETVIAGVPGVASTRKVGHWPMGRPIEVTLRTPSTRMSEPRVMTGSDGSSYQHVRTGKLTSSLRSLLVPVLNGSVGLGFGSLFLLIAIDRVGLAIAFTLSNTSLLWVALLSSIFLRERLTLKTLVGVVVTVVGVTMVVI